MRNIYCRYINSKVIEFFKQLYELILLHHIQMEKEIMVQYVELVMAEENCYKDKFKVKWLQARDLDIALFCRKVKVHHP